MAAVDYFLKIDGIPGESQDEKHKGEIDVESYAWGATQTASQGGAGGAGAGKVQMQDFHFVTRVSRATPKLLLACASGRHIKEATLTARRAGEAQQEFLLYRFTDVLITSYQTGGGDSLPVDQVSFSFAKIETEYRPQKPDGSLAAPEKAGWNVKKNKAV